MMEMKEGQIQAYTYKSLDQVGMCTLIEWRLLSHLKPQGVY